MDSIRDLSPLPTRPSYTLASRYAADPRPSDNTEVVDIASGPQTHSHQACVRCSATDPPFR